MSRGLVGAVLTPVSAKAEAITTVKRIADKIKDFIETSSQKTEFELEIILT